VSLPDSGWVSFRIRESGDVPAAIELFRMGYERARAKAEQRVARS
jgi:Family of unknown function (DUF5519)